MARSRLDRMRPGIVPDELKGGLATSVAGAKLRSRGPARARRSSPSSCHAAARTGLQGTNLNPFQEALRASSLPPAWCEGFEQGLRSRRAALALPSSTARGPGSATMPAALEAVERGIRLFPSPTVRVAQTL